MTKIAASSSWLTQVDHRLMAAEALRNVATTMGRQIEVKIRLNDGDIKAAEVVIFASDVRIQRDQFNETGFSTYDSRQIELPNLASKGRFERRIKESFRRWSTHQRAQTRRGAGEEVSVSVGRVVRIKSRSTGWNLLHEEPEKSDS